LEIPAISSAEDILEFYFPKEGIFSCYPANVILNGKLIGSAEKNE